MNRLQTLIFDFDFTLVDASSGIIDSTNQTLVQMGHDPVGEEVILPTIGLPLEKMFRRFVPEVYHADSELFKDKYKANAAGIMTGETKLLPGVSTALDELGQAGHFMGIVSTKTRIRIEEVLEKFDLKKYFRVVIGGDEVAENKPSPMGLLHAMEVLSVTKNETLYIGDSTTDAKTARNAGVAFVAVLTGVTKREDFAEYSPLMICEEFGELLHVLEKK